MTAHRTHIWTCSTTSYEAFRAVVFDFAEGRDGQHVRGLHTANLSFI